MAISSTKGIRVRSNEATLFENNDGKVTKRHFTILGTNDSVVPTIKQLVLMDDESFKFHFLTLKENGDCSLEEGERHACYEVCENQLLVSKGIWIVARYNFTPAPIDIQGILKGLKKS